MRIHHPTERSGWRVRQTILGDAVGFLIVGLIILAVAWMLALYKVSRIPIGG